ncbi:MAG: oxygenase MpaB family protein [Draconibacterium sp.]
MGNDAKKFIWNGIDLEQLRQTMDDPADKAVSSLFNSESMGNLRELLTVMAKNDDFVSLKLPDEMHNFVQTELKFNFSQQDINYFKQTHEIWKRDGMQFIFILFFRALPYTYMAEKPANVLDITKLLETQTERRIFETAQFVFDVMDKDWWYPEKRGILTALKVRLMHASMRHVILINNTTNKQWNEEWGNPISQEDLIATNQVFSLEFFKGMNMLGESLTPTEQAAWFHTWKTIAKIMGVQDELLSKDVEEAWSLQHTIYDHLFRDKTIAGVKLATALVKTLNTFHLHEELTLYIMKRMLADEQFPDCFERMLGPSFKDVCPELFTEHDTDEEVDANDKQMRQNFKDHLIKYHSTLKDVRPNYASPKPKLNWLEKIWFFILIIFGGQKEKLHLIDKHMNKLNDILYIDGTEEAVDELEEEAIIGAMNALGGILVGILSFHFRKGKNSGFRIPENLQEHWSLK